MSNLFNLPAGHILTATVGEGLGQINMIGDSSIGDVFRGSLSFGPYMVPTEFRYSGDVTVTSAASLAVLGSLLTTNAGIPAAAVRATVNVNPTGDENGLTYTAKAYGTIGNSISVQYVDPGANSAALSVSVFRQEITVSLATDGSGTITSTAAQVKAAIEADLVASGLVTVTIMAADSGSADDGSGVVTAMAKTALTGGAGVGIDTVVAGGICIDTTNGLVYRNSGTQAVPVWTALADVA